jgi:hypothetical protein
MTPVILLHSTGCDSDVDSGGMLAGSDVLSLWHLGNGCRADWSPYGCDTDAC